MVEQRRLSSGVVVTRRVPGGHVYLLLRAYRNWDFPKGLVEPGESPLEGARREVAEETGIEDLVFSWGEPFVETPPYAQGKVARYYVAETRTEAVDLGRNPAGRREHHEYRWVRHPQARQLVVPRVQVVLDWAEGLVTSAG